MKAVQQRQETDKTPESSRELIRNTVLQYDRVDPQIYNTAQARPHIVDYRANVGHHAEST